MSSITPQLVLASGSPRRQSLLRDAGYQFQVIVPRPEAECGVCTSTGPSDLVRQLALRKAADVVEQISGSGDHAARVLLAADTVAECRGQVLGKPLDAEHARKMLEQMQGREHRVYTGICVWSLSKREDLQPPHVEAVVTNLIMDPLTDGQIDVYLDSDAWCGKAGGFGYQDGLDWVHVVEGSESNVVGLPMERVAELLAKFQVFTRPLP
ncbi:MAG: Maf family protein [Aeoliella sp.]